MEKTQPPTSARDHAVTIEARIQILLEEYRALYSLLTFRLTAMDRRLPAIGGTLAGILASTTANTTVELAGYAAYSLVCAVIMLAATRRLHGYRYQRPTPQVASILEP